MQSGTRRLISYLMVATLLVAVGTLAFFTVRNTLQLDRLRQQSVIEATVALAHEKAQRIDRQIIDQDNVAAQMADPAKLDQLAQRWLPTAKRETPTVRALFVLDAQGNVLGYASRSSASPNEDESFRRLLVTRLIHEMEATREPVEQLRHLHRAYLGQDYLLSYWTRRWNGHAYLVVAWHDIARIVKETFAVTLADSASSGSRVNVLDEEGRSIAGPPLRSGEFSVSVRFPTTLYNWRVQVTPTSAEALAQRVENRRKLELSMVGLSCLVVAAGVVTLLIASEKQRRLTALKSDFVANVSHELKTPLSLVRMFAEMLHSGRVASEQKRREYTEIIVRESERLSALIDNVLDFAKLERGHGLWQKTDVDVGAIVQNVVNAASARAERAGIALICRCKEPLLPVQADAHAIELAVSNLIDNALKYAPESREVVVRVQRHKRLLQILVDDGGKGVAPGEITRIFERFERGKATASDPGSPPVRGTGIGLSLVKQVAESHGGKAWAENRRDENGQVLGARFVVALPVSKTFRRSKPPSGGFP